MNPDNAQPAQTPSVPAKVTAAICTRNRGASIVETIQTVLKNDYPNFELMIVDQSTNEETAEALEPYLHDPRFRYIRMRKVGASRARNLCLAEATTEVVVFTDDDCTVPPDWLTIMADVYQQNPDVIVAFCNVEAAPFDPKAGFIPAYVRSGEQKLTKVADKLKARGIGAGISARRVPLLNLGGFDPELGPGGKFPACEDGDVAVRALLKGHAVWETSRTSVLHFGYRTHAEGALLAQRDWLGIGAAYTKPLKTGHPSFWVVPCYEFFCYAVWPIFNDVLHLRRPRGFSRVLYFLKGFFAGLRTPVDRETLLFRFPESDAAPETAATK